MKVDDLLAELELTISELELRESAPNSLSSDSPLRQANNKAYPIQNALNALNPPANLVGLPNNISFRKQSLGDATTRDLQKYPPPQMPLPGRKASLPGSLMQHQLNQNQAFALQYYQQNGYAPQQPFVPQGYSNNIEYFELPETARDQEVRFLRNQLERAKQDIIDQRQMVDVQQHRNQVPERRYPATESVFSQASTGSSTLTGQMSNGGSNFTGSTFIQYKQSASEKQRQQPESVFSHASTSNSSLSEKSTASPRTARNAKKSPTGWTGRSSQRQPGKIADTVIDEACNVDNELDFLTVMSVVAMVKGAAAAPANKGKGASDAINAILYVINFEDPEVVKRGLDVLDIMYRNSGAIFMLNVSLNLDFFVHFLETRKHISAAEKDNVKVLAGMFAGWYLLDASKKDLAEAGNLGDPTVKVKEFFEGLLRADYEFPPGCLESIPNEKLASITAWSIIRRPFSFKTYKK
ncbi:hypothetical protein HK100_002781 [Physocladia obscura]|uniref:VHS domain-containing protein n=1 Tax=Physocladia obscura TaxID=109957 RepID=A0AAD5T9S3_9FUNG|nr:hypothetical protein HK100_002781 [Physocladia obscura]